MYFYYYSFKLVGTKFVHTTNNELPGELYLQSKYGGANEKIKRLEPNEPHKTLGCYISINMSQDKQFAVLKEKLQDWTNKIQTSPLSSEDKIYAYKTILEKQLLYVLPICSLTYKQCSELDSILSPALFNSHKI